MKLVERHLRAARPELAPQRRQVRAAELLSMSKAAVSRYVTDLETRLGVRLMQRTTRTTATKVRIS